MNLFSILAPIYDTLLSGVQQHHAAILLDRLPDLAGKAILDVGGGTGKLAHKLRECGADAWLLDASPAMLRRARHVLPADRIFRGDSAYLSFSDSSFDMVLMVDSLHHFEMQESAIRESLRILRPKGSLLIIEFTPKNQFIRALQHMERLAGEKSKFLTSSVLEAMLQSAGFSSVKTEYISAYEYLTQADA